MRLRFVHILLIIFIFLSASAQDKSIEELQKESGRQFEDDTTHKSGWKTGGLFTLNLAQGSLTNWQAGGDNNSFSAVGFLNLFAVLKEGRHLWTNIGDFGYGYLNTTTLGSRKSDDRIDVISKYGYQVSKKWYAGMMFNFRSQFANGYLYEKDANGVETKTLTSNFLAPAYVLLSFGFDYRPSPGFSVFLSPFTERWVIVDDESLSAQGAYGVEPGKKSKNEVGAFLSAQLIRNIMTNVTLKSRFDAFSNYKNNPGNVDIFWTNIVAMKVNKFLSANITLDFLYDDDAIGRLQIRQLLGIGFSAKF